MTSTVNPIEAAVRPLKEDAMNRAEKYARAIIEKAVAEVAASSLTECAPYPKAWKAPTATVEQYRAAKIKHDLYRILAGPGSEKGQAKFIEDARENAAAQYEEFIAKLNGKIGVVTAANLNGNHVWGHSILTVTKADGTTENWKTQTIVNVSKLGKVFNQFPTRKVK
jgi:hypothetical protein